LNVHFHQEAIVSLPCDLVALGVGEDMAEALASLDAKFDGQLLPWLEAKEFEGRVGNQCLVPTFAKLESKQLLLVGVGQNTTADLITAAGVAGHAARSNKAAHLALDLGPLSDEQIIPVMEAVRAGNYVYDKFKPGKSQTPALATLTVGSLDDNETNQKMARHANIRAASQDQVRDLVNTPAADLYPEVLAEVAKTYAEIDNVEVEVWDFDRCKQEKCVGIVAVGQGSAKPGCLIHVSYRHDSAKGHVALVGKGVTFDAGGLSLKPSSSMQTMRCDMGGAATVLGAIRAVAELGIPLNVDCFVGAVENMASSNSYKLGDVLSYANGVTVEIHNTDAEGRLVLADCLIQAGKITEATHIIDAATLTGACVVALGPELSGVFTKDDDFANEFIDAAESVGEGFWRLPLHQSYKKMLKADWAEIKNVGSREGGAITAALFLQHFVPEDKKWCHLDIAPASWFDKQTSYFVSGATGQGARALATWMERMAK
jgi:leucyl aminopeptidase